MGILDRFFKPKPAQENAFHEITTENFFLGSPEAESEATTTPIRLSDFFEDYLSIFKAINQDKFIVLGRKGSGKTAIGERIYGLAKDEPNVFCKFIKNSDINVEEIIQIGQQNGCEIQKELLYKWLILTNILDLMVKNENLQNHPAMKHLRKFISKNRGFIDINKDELKQTLRKEGFSVGSEHLNRAITAIGKKESVIKAVKPEFYKLIPNLQSTIVEILKEDSDNKYIVIFDDLDVNFHSKEQSDIDTMSNLIRMARYFNIDVFGRNNIDSKILILLRTDISKSLIYSADMGKIFNSYAIKLNWYEDGLQEKKLLLRQFINKRIKVNFEKNNLVINNLDDPWTSFVDEDSFTYQYGTRKTGFKYILDYTFFRPRDLILFFKDIDQLKLPLPLTRDSIRNELLNRYANAMVCDIKGELSLLYTPEEIESVFRALKESFGTNRAPFSYECLAINLRKAGIIENIDSLIEILFNYSLIGNYDDKNVYFKFRESDEEDVKLDRSLKLILHYVLQAYFYHY